MTVLCVDTNWIALYSLKKKVKRILPSATVYTCRKADEALDLAQKLGCDVLITEIDFGGEK
jgi:DNA-binding NarL/FixJ family response regulator